MPRVPTDAASDQGRVVRDVPLDLTVADAGFIQDGALTDQSGLDATDAPDAPIGVDLWMGMDTVTDVSTDVSLRDSGTDTAVVALVDAALDAPLDVPPTDTSAGDTGTDGVSMVDGGCTPGDTRACYTGSASSANAGMCRDGVQTCDATGRWGGCVGEIVPDCVNRMCGSDQCSGSCGSCPTGSVCDDSGQCVVRPCGTSEFTIVCPGGTTCPTGSACSTGGTCACQAGYIAVDCTGVACSPCTFPNWLCIPSPFCGAGEFLCPSGARCPRHSTCDPATGACLCNPGYAATTCSGASCTACPGTDYQCVAVP